MHHFVAELLELSWTRAQQRFLASSAETQKVAGAVAAAAVAVFAVAGKGHLAAGGLAAAVGEAMGDYIPSNFAHCVRRKPSHLGRLLAAVADAVAGYRAVAVGK